MKLLALFQGVPVKRKLIYIAFLATGAALIFAFLMLLVQQWLATRAGMVQSVSSQARIIATNSASALVFNDPEAATQTLNAMDSIANIEFAIIYGKDGSLFASYPLHAVAPALSPYLPDVEQYFFSVGHLDVFYPIVLEGERIGVLHVRSSLAQLYSQMLWNAAGLLVAMLGGLGIALVSAIRLHPVITGPVADLVGLMDRVSRKKNYALRAEVHGGDELGDLANGFNEMLAQIQARDSELEQRALQLARAQEELVRKEKFAVLGQIAGSVGHELRNPLGVMSNAVYFLKTVLTEADDTVKEYLKIIENEIAGSNRIVSDLLDAVRTRPPRREMASVRELVAATLGKLSTPASVIVTQEIPASLPALWVDPPQIHQVLRNILSNAFEAMPQGGTLAIKAGADELAKNITITVRDSGIGMTAEQLGRLFQPLYTTKARGIGLGLVVVKNLAEANGGKVEVESEMGKGTVFTISLPAVDERSDLKI